MEIFDDYFSGEVYTQNGTEYYIFHKTYNESQFERGILTNPNCDFYMLCRIEIFSDVI